ncbi:MAG: glutamate decarboxylase [Lachnospiraceae bacterium]|nr:glutamate decarboxylase [Lachnospiraceae bacterium]
MKINRTEMNASLAYKLLHVNLLSDNEPKKNVGTFSQVSMEPEAVKLMCETLNINASGVNTYKSMAEMEKNCIDILADLWHRPLSPLETLPNTEIKKPIGISTIGSSEACILGALAMLMKWKEWAGKNNLKHLKKPNLIIFCCHHICWEKFSNLCDVELIKIPMNKHNLTMDTVKAFNEINEYTIGIVAILGNTYTGLYDNVKGLNQIINKYNCLNKNKVYIHVDAASGGLYEPFVNPENEWDFRQKNVVSINVSGHKYGLVYPGIGWIVWRSNEFIPDNIVSIIEYLCGSVCTVGLNFTKSASQIVAQYYIFKRYGFSGYRKIHIKTRQMAGYLERKILDIGLFTIIGSGREEKIPLVCWALKDASKISWSLSDLTQELFGMGWSIPAYNLEDDMKDIIIQRFLCRADMDIDFIDDFLKDMRLAIKSLSLLPIMRKEF